MNEELKKKADRICANYPVKRAALLPVLRLIQETYGSISPEAEQEAAQYFEIPLADVREVTTFYTLFYSKAKGKCHIQLCRTLSCHLRGAEELRRHLENRLGIRAGETTPDGKISFDEVECLGACELAPMAQVNKEFIGPLSAGQLDEIVKNCSDDRSCHSPARLPDGGQA